MLISRRAVLTASASVLAVATTPRIAIAAPESRLLNAYWTRSGEGDDPDAAPWAAMLSRRVALGSDGVARFDYAGTTPMEIAELKAWLAAYQATDPTALTRPAQMAYWINLYNARTIELVLEVYPVDSIRDVRGGIFNLGPWDEKVMRVAGQALSLDDVEHGILRPIWRDPRIHYAVNCASIGCPNLAATPYYSSRLPMMLEDAARAFIRHPRGASVEDGRLVVSSIYDWFEADFGGSEAGVLRHLSGYADPALSTTLAERIKRGERYDAHRYDWRLNALV